MKNFKFESLKVKSCENTCCLAVILFYNKYIFLTLLIIFFATIVDIKLDETWTF